MRVVEIRAFGFEGLAVGERPRPVAGPGQALLRMRAASLNYRDLLMVRGEYDRKMKLPLIPCSDGAAEVVEVGSDVERVRAGDRVAPIFAQRWISGAPARDKLRSTLGGPLDGTLAELVALDAEGLVHIPPHLTDEEAATLPCAGVTAWNALVTHGGLRAGETVLVQGTGGVAVFALQFARMLGARAIVISSSDEKLERARALGADETLNYRSVPEWGRQVKSLSGGEGVDLVVDLGGAGTLAQSLAAVRLGGRISQIGMLGGASAPLNVIPIHMRLIRIQGILVGHREDFEAMNRAIDAQRLRPHVDRVWSLEEAPQAFRCMADAEHFGKLCIRIA